MKVKNIMFSGFMAAVLAGACGAADAATVLASKEFVTTELGKKQDTLTAGTNIAIDPDTNTISSTYEYNDSELSEKVSDLETAVGNAEGGLVKEVAGIKDVIDTLADAEGVAALTNDVSDLKEAMAGLPADQTVAQAIAGAVSDKVTNTSLTTTLEGYTTDAEYNTLAGRVGTNETNIATNSQAITGLQSGKADKSALDALTAADGKITVLETTVATHTTDIAGLKSADTGLGNRLTALESGDNSVAKQIENATTALEGQINAKADASVVSGLSDDLDALEADAITKTNMATELAGYATDAELGAVSAVANAAQTAAQVKDTVEAYGYQTSEQVESAITAKGYATKTYVDNQDAATLQSAKADAAATYQVKGDYMVDPADKGTYLVTRAEDGTVSYSAVQVVGANDTILLQ